MGKIILVPDSFKGNMSSTEVCETVRKGLSAAGTLAGMGISSYSTLASTGSGFNAARSYDWSGSTFASTMA